VSSHVAAADRPDAGDDRHGRDGDDGGVEVWCQRHQRLEARHGRGREQPTGGREDDGDGNGGEQAGDQPGVGGDWSAAGGRVVAPSREPVVTVVRVRLAW